jgi:hypothetical protein
MLLFPLWREKWCRIVPPPRQLLGCTIASLADGATVGSFSTHRSRLVTIPQRRRCRRRPSAGPSIGRSCFRALPRSCALAWGSPRLARQPSAAVRVRSPPLCAAACLPRHPVPLPHHRVAVLGRNVLKVADVLKRVPVCSRKLKAFLGSPRRA